MTLVARRSPLAAAASDDAASGMPPTAREWRHFTASSDGTRIECLITDFPRAEDEKRAREDWFILVHAHPKLGGCRQMMLPLARSLAARGHGSVCVALRGTSESLGSSTWRGSEAEGEDVLAACALAANGTLAGANANARCHLVGYSYGGTICGYALKRKHPNVASYIAIGYPRGSYGCGLYGVGAKWLMRDHFDALAESETPKLFIHPERDEFTTVKTMETLVEEKLERGVRELRVLKGADHFSAATDARVGEQTVDWILEFVARCARREDSS